MQYRFFTIPVIGDEEWETELNTFLKAERVLNVDRHLIQDGRNSVWAICVSYQDGARQGTKDKRAKPDYRNLLSDPEFAVFSRMRSLRKQLADQEGIPAYAVFTNDHLAEIVQRRADTPKTMREIDGIGEARIEKYGAAFQAVIKEAALPPREPVTREKVIS